VASYGNADSNQSSNLEVEFFNSSVETYLGLNLAGNNTND